MIQFTKTDMCMMYHMLQVKWVMNRLFHSLREEFDLQESYSGESVLQMVLSTIKVV